MIWLVFLFTLLFLYFLLLLVLAFGYLKTPEFIPSTTLSTTPVTIIVCARNEEKHISRCLQSILAQQYKPSLLQLIVVNDASSDKTLEIARAILEVSEIDYLILNNSSSLGKKASITRAIQHAKHSTLVTRDADTYTTSTQWLNSLVQYKETNAYDFVIGPVALENCSGLLWALQCVENNVLTVFSAGSHYFKKPFLCSGANMLFTKTLFEKTNGYQSHMHIASGDDVLFLEDVKKIPAIRIGFLLTKLALVYTYPQLHSGDMLSQKVRWAQKFKQNPNLFNVFFSILTFLVNFTWIGAFVGFFLHTPFHNYLLLFIVLKLSGELFLLLLSRRFMNNKLLMWYAPAVALIYPFYAVCVALFTLFLRPKWK